MRETGEKPNKSLQLSPKVRLIIRVRWSVAVVLLAWV